MTTLVHLRLIKNASKHLVFNFYNIQMYFDLFSLC